MTQIIERPPSFGDDAHEPPMFTPVPTATNLTMVQAINRALHDAMAADDRVLVFGEDVATLGGVFRVTEGLTETFGDGRCFDTPLAESAIIGIAVGLAIRGFVPVPEIQFDGFSYPAFDQIVSHLAKYRVRTHGDVDMPVTIRIPSFGGIGAVEHHSESTESYWAHTAGLKVVVPSTPSDAYWLLRHSIASRDPVVFLEPKRRYWSREDVDTSEPGLPIGRAAVRRIGDDVTVLTYGGLVQTAPGGSRSGRRPLRLEPRGRRPAVAQPARLRHHRRVGAQDRPRRGRSRGCPHSRLRRRVRGPHPGGVVLRPGGAGVARHRIRHAVSARAAGEAVAARRRPAARLRREGDAAHEPPSGVRDFLVPDLGEGLEDATITSWSVAVGDDVELNQTLCTVETNKAEVEIPSPYAGRIVELGGAEGETLAVGAVLVRIATDAPAPVSQNGGKPRASRCWSAMAPTTRWTPVDGLRPGRHAAPRQACRCASSPPTCTSTWRR